VDGLRPQKVLTQVAKPCCVGGQEHVEVRPKGLATWIAERRHASRAKQFVIRSSVGSSLLFLWARIRERRLFEGPAAA
jgi:hypothetical protein